MAPRGSAAAAQSGVADVAPSGRAMPRTIWSSSSRAAGDTWRPARLSTRRLPWFRIGLDSGRLARLRAQVGGDGDGRSQRVADAGGGELPQRLEGRGGQHIAQPHLFADLGGLDVLAHAEAFLHGGAGIVGQIGQQQRPAQAGERMVVAHDGADGLGPRVMRAQPRVVGRLEHQADIGLVVDDALRDLGGARHVDVQRDLGMAAPVARQHAVEHHFHEALAQHQVDMAALGLAQAVDLGRSCPGCPAAVSRSAPACGRRRSAPDRVRAARTGPCRNRAPARRWPG